jgi:hypothetical protein
MRGIFFLIIEFIGNVTVPGILKDIRQIALIAKLSFLVFVLREEKLAK